MEPKTTKKPSRKLVVFKRELPFYLMLIIFFPLRRWTKGYTIKQPNMDCQPTEITALMRHRAVFS